MMKRMLLQALVFAAVILTGCIETEDQPQVVQCEPSQYQQDFIDELNRIRRMPKHCGDAFFGTASPVTFDCRLEPAAEIHSLDMAYSGIVRHVGSNGVGLYGRLTETDYPWLNAGEVIASGTPDPKLILQSMVAESRHCSVLMEPRFYDAAVFRVTTDDSEGRSYWTLVMANQQSMVGPL